ncbi:LGFP repeat-containing protein [Williamsia deligens]|uniref:LGFP repeat-containing protein n=1 Tax=Williamsia deligens TaxID=321325 RepID=A0ABW3GHI4_9NOCA|nr:hypothetical protein [Williamsia deligens]MCP2195635.1 LGFP repeat-containing protein [Williamsia deligens]
MTDTLFADVSFYQPPVDDSYPYPILSIRSNDGTFRDPNFPANHAWVRRSLDSGRLTVAIVYCYVRPNWQETTATMRDMIERAGGLHPRVVLMLDVESGGNPPGDGSDWINRTYWDLVDYCGGNPRRVIGYANAADFTAMWRTRPPGLRVIGAGYGRNPNLPGQIAHQYTDGQGWGGGLPEGAPPFGRCDMNSADGLTAEQFAVACGIGTLSAVNEIDEAARIAASWIGRRITVGETPCPDGLGRFAAFENAHVYWSPTMPRTSDGRVHAIPIPHAGLFEAWAALGFEAGPLGYPAAVHTVLPDGGVQQFAGGTLFRRNGSPAGRWTHGAIGARYAELGGPAGGLGWPVTDEYADGAGRRQDFDRGTLRWTPSGGVTEVPIPVEKPAGTGLRDRLRQLLRRLLTRARPPRPGA